MSIDAQANVITHDDGQFVRTAIAPERGSGTSIVVLDASGEPVFKVNLFSGNTIDTIDIVPMRENCHCHTFRDGQRAESTIKNPRLVAVFSNHPDFE